MQADPARRRATAILEAAESFPFVTPTKERTPGWWSHMLGAHLARHLSAADDTKPLGGAVLALAGLLQSREPALALGRLTEVLGRIDGNRRTPTDTDDAKRGLALVEKGAERGVVTLACEGFVQVVNAAANQDDRDLFVGALATAALAGYRAQQREGGRYAMRWPEGTHDTEAMAYLVDDAFAEDPTREGFLAGLRQDAADATRLSQVEPAIPSRGRSIAEGRARAVARAHHLIVQASPTVSQAVTPPSSGARCCPTSARPTPSVAARRWANASISRWPPAPCRSTAW